MIGSVSLIPGSVVWLARLCLLQQAEVREPFLEADLPRAERDPVPRADTAAVAPRRIDVQLGGNARAEESIVELDRLARVEGIIAARAREEGGRGILRHGNHHLRIPAGINEPN